MKLLTPRTTYKPILYEFAFLAHQTQHKIHWVADEVNFADDVYDWNKVLTHEEKNLLTQIFRFFVQSDLDVAGAYVNTYLPIFQHPEVRMMLLSFGAMEAIHVEAYAKLIDTVGLPEVEYKAFLEYEEMRNKHEYILQYDPVKFLKDNPDCKPVEYQREIAKALAVFSGFTEGVQLFSSFAILLNFSRFGKMKRMSEIITWSIRDESLHVESMIRLLNTFVDEYPKVWTQTLKKEIYQIAEKMVELEDKFIDLCFKQGGIEGLTAEEIKGYVRYIADRRLLQMRLKPIFKQKTNPCSWLDWLLVAPSHTNFFEGRETSYAKGAMQGDWKEAFTELFGK